MSTTENKETENERNTSNYSSRSEKKETSFYNILSEEYSNVHLLGKEIDYLDERDDFSVFKSVEYKEELTDNNSVVILFPEFVKSNNDEEVFKLTEELLENGVEGMVVPSYDLGSPVKPPRPEDGLELENSFWNVDKYGDKALLYKD